MRVVVWLMILVLLILHQDNWNWECTKLDFGFMPRSLLYHAAISVGAGITWFLATRFCWPADLENAESNAKGADA
jgi:hypothetical protein